MNQTDWFKNCIADGVVTVTMNAGTAELVDDEEIVRRVCMIKYPDSARAKERRVAIRVKLDVQ